MAKSKSVWGIDIGQAALKALRCSKNEDGTIVASSFDYIEYPKLLSQADADPDELVKEALETFLERNDLQGDSVAMSVSGQAGLSRFFRPPPVDAKTLPDIVKYEVKQQIPFPIEDVIWDWQRLGGTKSDDLIVDAEVGLFAIKRDSVFAALRPFNEAGIEVDIIQLAPLSIFNVIFHDVLGEIPEPDEIDPDNPPEALVVLSLGTDSTDLIISNGVKLWLRNIPIGGNHFTRQLSREMKLTHAKAEHLKRNVRQMAENEDVAKRVFQSMRPVFNDLVTEIQRSLTFYNGIEKNARIERVVLLGNAARLPGLRQYLTKQLELDIVKLNNFKSLHGDAVIKEKAFADNMLSYAPCYGLCLQGLHSSLLQTNLLPKEIVKERLIRAKKPWVLAAVAAIVAGMSLGYLFSILSWWRVDERFAQAGGPTWKAAFSEIEQKANLSKNFVNKDSDQTQTLVRLNKISSELADESESPATMAEFMSAIYQVLPKDEHNVNGILDPVKRPFDQRNEIYINSIETEAFWDLSTWRDKIRNRFDAQFERFLTIEQARSGVRAAPPLAIVEHDLTTNGWVVELHAHHFHNNREQRMRSEHQMEFVRRTLLKNLLEKTVKLPGEKMNPDGTYALEDFKLSDIGVFYPTVVSDRDIVRVTIPNINAGRARESDERGPGGASPPSGPNSQQDEDDSGDQDEVSSDTSGELDSDVKEFELFRYDFVLQLAWVPTTREGRIENRAARLEWETSEAARTENTGRGSLPEKTTPTPATVRDTDVEIADDDDE